VGNRPPIREELRLEGCLNLRDLGGLRTADRRRLRERCLFRSDQLCALTAEDLGVVAGLGIRVVLDLRNEGERLRRPNRVPPGVEVLERTTPASGTGRTLEEQIAARDIPERDDEYMAAVYIDLLTRLAPELRILVERAVEARERPLLFHCAAGKDRTGVAAAILLGLLGVPDDAILDDYEVTTTVAAPRRLAALGPLLSEHGVSEHRVRHLVEVRRPVLGAALRHVHERWGDFEAYAAEVLGTAPDLPERLREALLLPPRAG
jgi:protein-tyrosine phosphatase